jgi:hypothetical protein
MARNAIVDRDVVLGMLKEGATSRAIADRYGVSRQAIDLYRRRFITEGLLPEARRGRASPAPAAPVTSQPSAAQAGPVRPARSPTHSPTPPGTMPLDDLVDLIIKAFAALKQVPELEAEIAALKKSYDSSQAQIEELKAREQKRKEQEARWLQAQNPGVLTYRPPSA